MKNIIIGLTGPTGAGKTSACQAAADVGFKVVDCDKLARVAVEKGTAGLRAVTKAFGEEILKPDGTLNRKKLAVKAFSTKENTELLNKTLLPHIVELIKKETDAERVLLDAPTLFESGIVSICVSTIAVLADEDIRHDRIMKRDGIDKESAMLRIKAGKPNEYYFKNAEHIIYNNCEQTAFKAEFMAIINKILKENYRG